MSETPDSPVQPDQPFFEQVAEVINTIRPAIQNDGGDLELLGLTMGVERVLKEKLPQVTKVVLA